MNVIETAVIITPGTFPKCIYSATSAIIECCLHGKLWLDCLIFIGIQKQMVHTMKEPCKTHSVSQSINQNGEWLCGSSPTSHHELNDGHFKPRRIITKHSQCMNPFPLRDWTFCNCMLCAFELCFHHLLDDVRSRVQSTRERKVVRSVSVSNATLVCYLWQVPLNCMLVSDLFKFRHGYKW